MLKAEPLLPSTNSIQMILSPLKRFLNQTSSKAGIISLLILSQLVFLLMMTYTFPAINAQIGTPAFDLRPLGYSIFEAQAIIQKLDQKTIHLYLFPQLFLLDILYPALLALFLSSLLLRLYGLLGRKQASFFLLPFMAMLFDYLENMMITLLITNSVALSEGIVQVASTFTILKGAFTTFSWLLIVVLFTSWVREPKKYRRKTKTHSLN